MGITGFPDGFQEGWAQKGGSVRMLAWPNEALWGLCATKARADAGSSPQPFMSFHQASWRIGQGNWWGSFKTDSPRENSRRIGLETELKSAIYCKKSEKPQTLQESGGGSRSAGCGTASAQDWGLPVGNKAGLNARLNARVARCPPDGVFQIWLWSCWRCTGSSVVVVPSFAWAQGFLGPSGAKWEGRRLCSFVCSQEYSHSAFYPACWDTSERACLMRLNEWGLELQRVSTALRVKQCLELTESLQTLKRGVGSRKGERPKGKAKFQTPSNLPSRSQVPAGQPVLTTILWHSTVPPLQPPLLLHNAEAPTDNPINQLALAHPHLLLHFLLFSPFPFKSLACICLVSSLQMVLPTSFSPTP